MLENTRAGFLICLYKQRERVAYVSAFSMFLVVHAVKQSLTCVEASFPVSPRRSDDGERSQQNFNGFAKESFFCRLKRR